MIDIISHFSLEYSKNNRTRATRVSSEKSSTIESTSRLRFWRALYATFRGFSSAALGRVRRRSAWRAVRSFARRALYPVYNRHLDESCHPARGRVNFLARHAEASALLPSRSSFRRAPEFALKVEDGETSVARLLSARETESRVTSDRRRSRTSTGSEGIRSSFQSNSSSVRVSAVNLINTRVDSRTPFIARR